VHRATLDPRNLWMATEPYCHLNEEYKWKRRLVSSGPWSVSFDKILHKCEVLLQRKTLRFSRGITVSRLSASPEARFSTYKMQDSVPTRCYISLYFGQTTIQHLQADC
jgi:hypothetical protein